MAWADCPGDLIPARRVSAVCRPRRPRAAAPGVLRPRGPDAAAAGAVGRRRGRSGGRCGHPRRPRGGARRPPHRAGPHREWSPDRRRALGGHGVGPPLPAAAPRGPDLTRCRHRRRRVLRGPRVASRPRRAGPGPRIDLARRGRPGERAGPSGRGLRTRTSRRGPATSRGPRPTRRPVRRPRADRPRPEARCRPAVAGRRPGRAHHRAVRLGQVDDRARGRHPADRGGDHRDPARRGPGPTPPHRRARLLAGGP